jgi:hypothetical protein
MTKEEFPYWNEEETIKFLNYNESSMKNLRNSKALTRYQIGHRYFYDKKEVIKLIEDSKVYSQDNNEYQNYIVSINKSFSKKELNYFESTFVLIYAQNFLDYIQKLIPETNRLTNRDKLIMNMCLSYKNFKDVGEHFNLSSVRVSEIFKKTIRIISRLGFEMKDNYDNKYVPLQEENELLKKQIYQLQFQLQESKKGSINIEENTISNIHTEIYDLDISVRILTILKKNNLIKLGDIIKLRRKDFLIFRNFGRKSLLELEELLDRYGLQLK